MASSVATTSCAGCVFGAVSSTLLSYSAYVLETVTVSVIPHVTIFRNGSQTTSYISTTLTEAQVFDTAQSSGNNHTGRPSFTDPADLTWTVGGITLTYPSTYVSYGGFYGAAAITDNGQACVQQADATSMDLGATVDEASFIYPVNATPATGLPTPLLEYLNSLPVVSSQFNGDALTTCAQLTAAARAKRAEATETPLWDPGRYQDLKKQDVQHLKETLAHGPFKRALCKRVGEQITQTGAGEIITLTKTRTIPVTETLTNVTTSVIAPPTNFTTIPPSVATFTASTALSTSESGPVSPTTSLSTVISETETVITETVTTETVVTTNSHITATLFSARTGRAITTTEGPLQSDEGASLSADIDSATSTYAFSPAAQTHSSTNSSRAVQTDSSITTTQTVQTGSSTVTDQAADPTLPGQTTTTSENGTPDISYLISQIANMETQSVVTRSASATGTVSGGAVFSIGSTAVSSGSNGQYYYGTQVLTAGSTLTVGSGPSQTKVALVTSGGPTHLIVDGSTIQESAANLQSTSASQSPVTTYGNTFTALRNGSFVVLVDTSSIILAPANSSAAFSGQTVSVSTDGIAVVVNGETIIITASPSTTAHPEVIITGSGYTFTASPSGSSVILQNAESTIAVNHGSIVTFDGQAVSAASDGSDVVLYELSTIQATTSPTSTSTGLGGYINSGINDSPTSPSSTADSTVSSTTQSGAADFTTASLRFVAGACVLGCFMAMQSGRFHLPY